LVERIPATAVPAVQRETAETAELLPAATRSAGTISVVPQPQVISPVEMRRAQPLVVETKAATAQAAMHLQAKAMAEAPMAPALSVEPQRTDVESAQRPPVATRRMTAMTVATLAMPTAVMLMPVTLMAELVGLQTAATRRRVTEVLVAKVATAATQIPAMPMVATAAMRMQLRQVPVLIRQPMPSEAAVGPGPLVMQPAEAAESLVMVVLLETDSVARPMLMAEPQTAVTQQAEKRLVAMVALPKAMPPVG